MKMDFRCHTVFLSIAVLTLSACGKQKTSLSTFEKPSEECVADIVPKQFIMRYTDGSIKVVRAESTDQFLKDHVEHELSRVAYSEHDYFVHASPQIKQQTTVTSADNWAAMRIGADALWSSAVRGQGIAVAVVDSGMDLAHSQLAGQVLVNVDESGVDSAGLDKATNGIDDDNNGFIDDYKGYDFVANAPLRGDYQLHGSHVSGIIAAAHSDNTAGPQAYVQGIAPQAKILPLAFLNQIGSGMMSDGVRAIHYAVSRGVRVINASWGGPVCSKSLRDTVAGLSAANVMFVSAAGNDANNIDRYKEYPASLDAPSQITVGATGDHDLLANFSNYGSKYVHIFAPGQFIISTIPGQAMKSLSGTSMAAPVVTGAIALLLSAEPSATVAQLRKALYNAAYKDSYFLNACHGRLDLRTALAELRTQMGK